jgi:uncharacterized membrane protein
MLYASPASTGDLKSLVSIPGGRAMSTEARGAVLVAAALAMGLMAGVFGVYAHTIMRGLGDTDDRTFVGAFQAMDRAIINPLFMLAFMGALALTAGATLLYVRGDGGSTVTPWVVAALGLYVVVFLVTVTIHVPLNDGLKAAGDPDRIADLAAVRDAFHEGRWAAWNVVRAVATTVAFGCLLWALVLHGRSDVPSDEPRPVVAERVEAGSR